MRILEIVGEIIVLAFVLSVGIWLSIRALKRSVDPAREIFKLVITACIIVGEVLFARHASTSYGAYGMAFTMTISIAAAGVIVGTIWAGNIAELVARPLTSLFDDGNQPIEPKPYYSVAHARRKRREFPQAILVIREQLAKFPNDYEGVMLLAAIQAEDLQDLASAEMTLNRFCDQPDPPARQFAAAMNQLADWQIKIARDIDSARAALEKTILRFPDSEVALQAEQRIARLGGTARQMQAALERRPVAVPEGISSAGLRSSIRNLVPVEADPTRQASELVKHLEQYPLDTEAREKLAILYADSFQRLDMATIELNQLIELPHQPVKQVAHWLNLLADLQVRHGADYQTVRSTLERIVERFPALAAGEMARTRLDRLKLELRVQKETPAAKLGVYEQNIGLKRGAPRKL